MVKEFGIKARGYDGCSHTLSDARMIRKLRVPS
jgi:hypothetical protein